MNVLVIGDVIIDRYTHGQPRGISAETPTMVASLGKEEMFVGGAGLVVRNLLRLGANVTLLTVIPKSGAHQQLAWDFQNSADPTTQDEFDRLSIYGVRQQDWWTNEKRRYYVGPYKMLQYDRINQFHLEQFTEDELVRQYKKLLAGAHSVVVCDNRHGVVSEHIAISVVRLAKAKKIPVFVDSQVSQSPSNHEWYRGANFIFLNEREADSVADVLKYDGKRHGAQLGAVSKFLNANIVYKRGERGAITVPRNRDEVIVDEGFKVDAIDTCGAGDAFMAAFVFNDRDLKKANRWAALSTTYKGTIVPKVEDLEKVKR